MSVRSSMERRGGLSVACVAHLDNMPHEVNDAIGGEVLPRSMSTAMQFLGWTEQQKQNDHSQESTSLEAKGLRQTPTCSHRG